MLKIVKKLKPCEFKYKSTENEKYVKNDEKKHFGFIAQDVEKLFPEDEYGIVKKYDEYYAINYIEFIPIIVKVIKELSEKVEKLEEKANAL
jgi:hypothetical protein